MSLRCVNPSCYQGDPGNPPEFTSDDPFVCFGCGEVFDREEEFGGRDNDDNDLCEVCFDDREEEEE